MMNLTRFWSQVEASPQRLALLFSRYEPVVLGKAGGVPTGMGEALNDSYSDWIANTMNMMGTPGV
jgi:hypothetical protein